MYRGGTVEPEGPAPAAHDALNRLLYRLEPDTMPLWQEAEALVDRTRGLLIIDDSTLDKPYAHQIALVHWHWSGKHRKAVSGINLVSLVWSDDTHAVPCHYRLFDAPNDGLTKNDHFRAMLQTAMERGFTPRFVCFDSWYSGLANLKYIRSLGMALADPVEGEPAGESGRHGKSATGGLRHPQCGEPRPSERLWLHPGVPD